MKLLRVTGWGIKFIEKLKPFKNPNYTFKPYITSSNINEAKVLWIRDVQKDILTSFNYQNLQHQLSSYHDDTKLLRCGERLKNADIPYESKHPVILLKNHRFTDLVIIFYHCIIIFYCYDYGAKFLDFGVTDKPYFKSPHSSNTTR